MTHRWFSQIGTLLLFIIPAFGQTTTLTDMATDNYLDQWVAGQLKIQKVEMIKIIDHKLWPQAALPNTHIVLGTGKRPSSTSFNGIFAFPYVLLFQTGKSGPLNDAKLLAISVPGSEKQVGTMYVNPLNQKDNGPVKIDIGPYRLPKGETAFGVRYRVGSVGNKGGNAFEILGLFRYSNSELKEIFRDVVWAYSKYESGSNSCNSEMSITPSADGSSYTRKHVRSYYGESKANPEWARSAGITNRPVSSCRYFKGLEGVNTHRWNAEKEMYLDYTAERNGHLLWWDSLFKGDN